MPNNGWPEWFLPSVLASRPAVRINQLGYLPHGPKRATWITDELLPIEFTVVASHGSVALRGRTQPWPTRPEPTSGQSVHVIDFTDVTGAGTDYQVLVGEQRSHLFPIAQDLYGQLARDALGLFYLLRSGCPIDEQRAPGYGRPAGHTGVPPNRGDTAVPAWTGPEAARLYPGWAPTDRLDVSSGWYDAGDYGKYTVSGSIAVWQLLNILELLRRATGQRAVLSEEALIEECRWQLDWLLRMQVPPGEPLAGMALHRVHGTKWSPMPGLPHEDPTFRVLHRPSTGATLQVLGSAQHTAKVFDINGFDFDRVSGPARLDLALAGVGLPDHEQVVDSVRQGALHLTKLQRGQPWGQPYAPHDGWAWGSNGRILNNLVVLAAAAQLTGDAQFQAAVIMGVDYILGRNALGQSYVTGYGSDSTAHLRTRQFGHDLDPSLPPPPPGALAGGANSTETPGFPSDPRLRQLPPQCCYLDEPTSETTNDICIRWNAPLASIATYLSLA